MNINDIQTYMLSGYYICFSLIGIYFRLLCYFFVIRFLVFWMGFVTFAQAVINYQEGSHGTYKEIRVCTRPNPLQGIGEWEQVHLSRHIL